MLDIPSITGIVAAVGVMVGVVLTVLQLRDLVKTRQTDLVLRLCSTRAQRVGFQREGTIRKRFFSRGKWVDYYVFSILREKWKEPKILTKT